MTFQTGRRSVGVAHSASVGVEDVNAVLAELEHVGIINEVTGRRRGRVFGYRAYLDILNEGTAPLPPAAISSEIGSEIA